MEQRNAVPQGTARPRPPRTAEERQRDRRLALSLLTRLAAAAAALAVLLGVVLLVTQAEGQDGNKLLVTWTAHGVSWYTEKTISTAQNNRKDCTYQYFALGYDEPAE